MFNHTIGIMLSFSVIFLIIVSLDWEFTSSSKISFGQTSNFTDNNVISSSNSTSSNNNNNSSVINNSKIETATTGDWLTYSNNKFELEYPPHEWNVEKKLSKFHVLDFKLIKNNPFSF